MSNLKALPCDEVAIRSTPCATGYAARQSWVLAAAVLGSTLAYIDESVVNVALPKIESDLHATLAAMQWVINAYTLCMTALLLIGGAVADQYGRRLLLVIGVSIFAVASIGCGLAPNVHALVAARTVQGAGAALLVPCSLALIGAAFDEKQRGAAIGIWSGASAIASGAAPPLGGWLVDHWPWRVIFLINPLLAVPTLWIALRHVPESRDPDAQPGIDWLGAVLAFAGLGSLVYGLIASSGRGWGSPGVTAPLLVGAALLVLFVLVERHVRAPMMPLELFRSRTFTGVNLLTLLLYGALGGAFFFLPFLLIQARSYSATAAGVAYLPFTLVLAALSRWSGGLVDRFGARWPLIGGPVIVACGFALLASDASSYYAVLLVMTLLGFGMAVTVAPLTTTVINAVPPHRTGVASGINNAVAAGGGLLLIAMLGSVALSDFSRTMDRNLLETAASPRVTLAVHAARGAFVVPPFPADLSSEERRRARLIISDSLDATIRMTLWVATALTLAGALSAVVLIPPGRPAPNPHGAAPTPAGLTK